MFILNQIFYILEKITILNTLIALPNSYKKPTKKQDLSFNTRKKQNYCPYTDIRDRSPFSVPDNAIHDKIKTVA